MPGRATINPVSKLDTFTVFKMKNIIGILGRTYDLGLLKRELCPILIDTENYENVRSFNHAVNPKISTINWVDKDLEIVFERAPFGLKKLKLIDWKK